MLRYGRQQILFCSLVWLTQQNRTVFFAIIQTFCQCDSTIIDLPWVWWASKGKNWITLSAKMTLSDGNKIFTNVSMENVLTVLWIVQQSKVLVVLLPVVVVLSEALYTVNWIVSNLSRVESLLSSDAALNSCFSHTLIPASLLLSSIFLF